MLVRGSMRQRRDIRWRGLDFGALPFDGSASYLDRECFVFCRVAFPRRNKRNVGNAFLPRIAYLEVPSTRVLMAGKATNGHIPPLGESSGETCFFRPRSICRKSLPGTGFEPA